MIIYIVEDTLHCINNGKLITLKLKTCIEKGYIINRETFIQEFGKMLKKEKIKSKLFGDNITFVNNGYFSTGDLFFIESIFAELGFIKVEFLDIRELLPLANATYIEINNNYLILYLYDIVYLNLNYFNDIPKIISVIRPYLEQDIVLFGLNKWIPKMSLDNLNVYYIDNYKNYITYSLLKVKK